MRKRPQYCLDSPKRSRLTYTQFFAFISLPAPDDSSVTIIYSQYALKTAPLYSAAFELIVLYAVM